MRDEKRLGLLQWYDQAAQWPPHDDIGGRRLSQQDGDLAEEAARSEGRPLLIVDNHADLAVDDDEKAHARRSLPQHPMALRKRLLVQFSREFAQLELGQVGEDAESSEPARQIADHGHGPETTRKNGQSARRAEPTAADIWRGTRGNHGHTQ